MTEIQKLFEDAALGLVGRKVRVIFRIPITKNADGIAYLHLGTDEPYIEIRPNLSDKRTEYVFLHECSHHYLRHARRSAACFKRTIRVKSRADTKAERSTVNDQVAIWEAYAEANKNRYEGNDQARRLRALAWWLIDEMINAAASKAARKALARLPIIR